MSLKTAMRLPECVNNKWHPSLPSDVGLVGISSLDNKVYIWQKKEKDLNLFRSPLILIIYQVNPLVPSSWHVFKEIILDSYITRCVWSTFNACCSKMAFIFRNRDQVGRRQDELLMVDMASHQTEIKPVEQFYNVYFYQIAETVVGWVELVCPRNVSNFKTIVCRKMFLESNEDPVLFTLTPEHVDQVALTYDSLMSIECSNNLCKVVSYEWLSGNSVEMAFDQWNPLSPYPYPFLIAASDKAYLIRPSQDLGNRVYKAQQDHLGITLTYLNQLDGLGDLNFWKTGNDKFAVIHGHWRTKLLSLTVAHLGVPSLKSLAVWAIQKLYGTIGDHGELIDDISEEELKKSIGYQKNKKLF